MKAKLYNKLPQSLIKKIPKGKTVVFRLCNIKEDFDNPGQFLIPLNKNLAPTDEIYNPENDEFIPIAYITGVTANGKAKFGQILFQKVNGGCVILNANNPEHQKMYQYMSLSNYNKSNPNRSESFSAWFELVDNKQEAQQSRAERKIILKALRAADELEFAQVKSIASSLGHRLDKSEEELRDLVEDFAEYEPETFLNLVEQQTNEVEADIREAIDLQILKHSKSSAKFVWVDTKEEVFTYKKKIGVKPYTEFADYLLTENKEVYDAIKKRLQAERDNP